MNALTQFIVTIEKGKPIPWFARKFVHLSHLRNQIRNAFIILSITDTIFTVLFNIRSLWAHDSKIIETTKFFKSTLIWNVFQRKDMPQLTWGKKHSKELWQQVFQTRMKCKGHVIIVSICCDMRSVKKHRMKAFSAQIKNAFSFLMITLSLDRLDWCARRVRVSLQENSSKLRIQIWLFLRTSVLQSCLREVTLRINSDLKAVTSKLTRWPIKRNQLS